MELTLATTPVVQQELPMREYSLSINGVIEVISHINEQAFFDGLFDAIIEYAEQYHAFAGLTMSHKEYDYTDEESTEESNGKEAA